MTVAGRLLTFGDELAAQSRLIHPAHQRMRSDLRYVVLAKMLAKPAAARSALGLERPSAHRQEADVHRTVGRPDEDARKGPIENIQRLQIAPVGRQVLGLRSWS